MTLFAGDENGLRRSWFDDEVGQEFLGAWVPGQRDVDPDVVVLGDSHDGAGCDVDTPSRYDVDVNVLDWGGVAGRLCGDSASARRCPFAGRDASTASASDDTWRPGVVARGRASASGRAR